MNRRCRKQLWVIALAAPLLILVGCSSKKDEAAPAFVVETTHPSKAQAREQETFSFIAKPKRTTELSFRVSGPVHRLEAYAGNYYRCGSVIAEIDPRDFRLRKEKAEAEYKRLEAEYNRVTHLYEKNNVSASLFEKTRADFQAAQVALDESVNQLADTRLLAPFDGYIGEVFIEKYQDVRAAQAVVSFIDISQLRIEIFVTQDVAQQARTAKSISLTFDTEPDQTYQAEIVEVSKSTMSNNLSYLVTALLANPDGHLLAGMSGQACLPTAHEAASVGVEIPIGALCHRPKEGDFVWTVSENGMVRKRKVTRGELLPSGKVCVRQGLNCNDRVVTTGLRLLSEGTRVKVKK